MKKIILIAVSLLKGRLSAQLLAAILALTTMTSFAGSVLRAPEQYEKVDDFVGNPLGTSAIQSLEQLRKMGDLVREKTALVANIHYPSQADEIRTFEFDGLVLEAYFPNRESQRGFITEITVTKSRWKLKFDLRVGVSAKELQAVLGEPDERDDTHLEYCGDKACGVFSLQNGHVVKALFKSPMD